MEDYFSGEGHTTLKELRGSLTQSQLRRFFDLQVLSEHILDRKRAYEIAPTIYDATVDQLLWNSWRAHHDDGCMSVLAGNSESEALATEFSSIWRNPELRFAIKNNVLKRVAKHDFSLVFFLKAETPISYLSACVAANKRPSDEEAISIAKTADKLRTFQYAVWCIGMLGMHEALYKLLGESPEIEKLLPTEFWEVHFYEGGSSRRAMEWTPPA